MQILQPNVPGIPGEIDLIGSAPPVRVDASDCTSDHLEPIREEALQLLRPDRERAVMVCAVAGALLIGIGLGWAGCLGWNNSPVLASAPIVAKEASVRQTEAKPAARAESIRRQAPSITASINASRAARADDNPKSVAALLGS